MKEPWDMTWDGRNVADLLNLAAVGDDRFRSHCSEINERGRVFGGQMLGQAMAAAAQTVAPDRPATHLQFLFAAGGRPEQPIDYEVARLQDGKRFSSHAVRGLQANGRIICNASVSFAGAFEAPGHQAAPPDDCGLSFEPERLPALEDIDPADVRDVERAFGYGYQPHAAVELRAPYVADLLKTASQEPRVRFFIRLRQSLADEAALHACAFAYLSDYWINFVACIPHVEATTTTRTKLYIASLNHAIWFHRPLRADQWLLFDSRSPSSAFGRGLATARIYAQSGDLVATVAQECLLAPIA